MNKKYTPQTKPKAKGLKVNRDDRCRNLCTIYFQNTCFKLLGDLYNIFCAIRIFGKVVHSNIVVFVKFERLKSGNRSN